MKKVFISAIVFVLLTPGSGWAQDQFGRFQEFITRDSLKPFAKDLGGILGAATFHSGRSLGFSGFDIGIRGGMQFSPDPGNKVLRDSGVSAFGLPWFQAEIGLPFRLDGYIRGISYQGLTIAGGGLRYGITKSGDKDFKPQFLIATSAHSVVHAHFSANHVGGNLICSLSKGLATMYIGAGVDRTVVIVRSVPFLDPTLKDGRVTSIEPLGTLGFSVRPKPYLYLHAGYTISHGQNGLDSGIGIRF